MSLLDIFSALVFFPFNEVGGTVGLLEFDVGFKAFHLDRQSIRYDQKFVGGFLLSLFDVGMVKILDEAPLYGFRGVNGVVEITSEGALKRQQQD